MNKRLLAGVLACVMTLSLSMPVFATNSDSNGSASGTTALSGEIAYTTAYTLTIPSSINNMDLSMDAETTVGDVKVTKQDDTAEFDPSKKVSVTVSYAGELVNDKNSDKKVLYKLQQKKGDVAVTDITTDSKLDFSASEIEAGNVLYTLKAIVTETNKAGGTYSGTINFSAKVEDAKIRFIIACSSRDTETTHEVEPGTTWEEFLNSGVSTGLFIDSTDSGNGISCTKDKDNGWIYYNGRKVSTTDVIVDNATYSCP